MVKEHIVAKLTLIEVNDRLVFMVDEHGKHYATCNGEKALETAKFLTRMYWDEVHTLGEPVYTADISASNARSLDRLRAENEKLREENEQLRQGI